ncbi:hypothetical protein [Arcicella lustrica]|uniref:Uncharacterized protein n=1 Tax=Arcicella lustrica TaxID=2984196 RepID=A0ABU5SD88_9BACT|nr:hypothetical protein [Arcicella sp. DC25W]MEA5425260.1 hypothetical protein [Arcicella sp. DC25W]
MDRKQFLQNSLIEQVSSFKLAFYSFLNESHLDKLTDVNSSFIQQCPNPRFVLSP